MTPNDQGRHCMACAKTVVDFTEKTKEEIVDHLQNADEQVCGRMQKSQMKIPERQEPTRSIKTRWTWVRAKVAALGIFAMTSVNQLKAQTPVIHPHLGVEEPEYVLMGDTVIAPIVETFTITGTVEDKETGELIPFANVWVEGTEVGTTTDFDGNYTLEVDRELIKVGAISLMAQHLAYKNVLVEVLVTDQDVVCQNFELDNDALIMGMMVGYVVTPEQEAVERDNHSTSTQTTFTGRMLDMLLRR